MGSLETEKSNRPVNPEMDQDRAEDLFDNWRKYGYVMFPQQVSIYTHLGRQLRGDNVLEAGSGCGLGTAMLDSFGVAIAGTDKLQRNVNFARCLYPWIRFDCWDIHELWPGDKHDVVVSVETLEHVAHPELALANLMLAARWKLWISTPNGQGKLQPPENPCHVSEYTPREIITMLEKVRNVRTINIRAWDSFEIVNADTKIDPLVYEVML